MTQALAQPRLVQYDPPGFKEAWEMVASQLRMEMMPGAYDSWVRSLQPLSYKEGVFRLGAVNKITIEWVESRLRTRITRLLESLFNSSVTLHFTLIGAAEKFALAEPDPAVTQPPLSLLESAAASAPDSGPQEQTSPKQKSPAARVDAPAGLETAQAARVEPRVSEPAGPTERKKKPARPDDNGPDNGSPRKIQLQRAYGTERARIIQPERGMFLTMYFFTNWLPLLGHSAMTTILAARSLCYWNPMTGELRNVIETDMTELARRADVSVRTVKDVLNHPLVKQYFLRYRVRRVMTPNGVRTAGIILQVRMDDPLTPEDQDQHHLTEEDRWYSADFEDESADD